MDAGVQVGPDPFRIHKFHAWRAARGEAFKDGPRGAKWLNEGLGAFGGTS